MIPRLDVASGAVAGAITTLLIMIFQFGDWSSLDWTGAASAFTVLFAAGLGYLVKTQSKEVVVGVAGAAAIIVVGLLQLIFLGTPFDVPSYASAITAIVTFLITTVVPRIQPVSNGSTGRDDRNGGAL